MTLSTTQNTKSYVGDNSTVAFAFPYLFFENGDLVVTIDGVVKTLNGAGTYDYSATGADNPSGGTVTFNNAPLTDVEIVIQRIVDYNQETDFENFDGNPADVTEKQFDLVVMQTQQIAEQQGRTILTPVTTTLASNVIGGTIDTTARALTITTDGLSTSLLASFGDDLDVILTSESSGDLLQYNGSNWVNVTTLTGDLTISGNTTHSGVLDVTNINAIGSGGGNLRTNGGTNCLSWGGGGSANLTLGGNMSGASTQKLVNMADGTSAQDYVTKAQLDGIQSGGWVPIQTQTVSSAVASVDFTTGIDGTYKAYAVVIDGLEAVTDGQELWSRLGNGGSFDNGASDYAYITDINYSSSFKLNSSGQDAIKLSRDTGNGANESLSGVVFIHEISEATFTKLKYELMDLSDTGEVQYIFGAAARLEAAAHDRIQFLMQSGNIDAGTFTLYGLAGA